MLPLLSLIIFIPLVAGLAMLFMPAARRDWIRRTALAAATLDLILSVIVYFSSNDCGVEHDRTVEAGGQSIRPKTPIPPFGCIAIIRDPDGNRIGIHSMA